MAVATTLPKIVYGSVTLYLPRNFTSWDLQYLNNNVVVKGPTYIQVCSYPNAYELKATTDVWCNLSDSWDGGTAGLFLTEWLTFYNTHAKLGKVFSFYRRGDDSTAGQSYFQYCVWTGTTDGIKRLIGHERYTLDILFRTEGAPR